MDSTTWIGNSITSSITRDEIVYFFRRIHQKLEVCLNQWEAVVHLIVRT